MIQYWRKLAISGAGHLCFVPKRNAIANHAVKPTSPIWLDPRRDKFHVSNFSNGVERLRCKFCYSVEQTPRLEFVAVSLSARTDRDGTSELRESRAKSSLLARRGGDS